MKRERTVDESGRKERDGEIANNATINEQDRGGECEGGEKEEK